MLPPFDYLFGWLWMPPPIYPRACLSTGAQYLRRSCRRWELMPSEPMSASDVTLRCAERPARPSKRAVMFPGVSSLPLTS
eukprot:scaffold735_cov376-Prasinococcus_capsulatus_cf.AAC.16